MDAAFWIDASGKVGFPIVAAIAMGLTMFAIARWFMRTGDELKVRMLKHVDTLDEQLEQIKPQLDRIETAAASGRCRAPGLPPTFASAEPAASH